MPTQPTFENSLTVATLEQTGDSTSGVWAEQTLDFPLGDLSATRNYGVTFNFGVSVEGERSLNLAPSIPYTDVNSDLAGTSEADRPWNLLIPTTLLAPSNAILYVTSESTPEIFNSTTQLAETSASPAPYLYESYTTLSSEWTTYSLFNLYALLIPLDFSKTLTPVGGSPVTHAINKLVRNPLWNGRLQFFLTTTGTSAQINPSTLFVGPTVPFHTGQMGLDIHRRARVVHDYINGFPYLSDEATEDPWREGVMVHSSSTDPTETRRHNPYVPPAAEGVVDDDIPNVE